MTDEATLTKGRRRSDGTSMADLEPGDYCRRLVPADGERPAWWRWWVCLPDGGTTPLAHPEHTDSHGRHHEVLEHCDGSISVLPYEHNSNSILSPRGWHGYIRHGVWQPA